MRVMFSDASSFPETKSATLRRGTACEKKGTGATAWRGNAGSRFGEFYRQRPGSRSWHQRDASDSNVRCFAKSLQYKSERRRSVFSGTDLSSWSFYLVLTREGPLCPCLPE